MDDSGTRQPDRQRGPDETHDGWFALGGLLIKEADIDEAEEKIAAFRSAWPQLAAAPLHSYDLRNSRGQFKWLRELTPGRRTQFMAELTELIIGLPIVALACVVDRTGYNKRYLKEYGPRRWMLCRTAFFIAVERAAKFARQSGARLRVYVERCDQKTDRRTREYYNTMKSTGLPFSSERSAPHRPLAVEQLRETLYEFRLKDKTSALMQIADLVLWPLCAQRYGLGGQAYNALRDAGRLMETICTPENGLQGTKYSCFDSAEVLSA
jgi:hypothetical protein